MPLFALGLIRHPTVLFSLPLGARCQVLPHREQEQRKPLVLQSTCPLFGELLGWGQMSILYFVCVFFFNTCELGTVSPAEAPILQSEPTPSSGGKRSFPSIPVTYPTFLQSQQPQDMRALGSLGQVTAGAGPVLTGWTGRTTLQSEVERTGWKVRTGCVCLCPGACPQADPERAGEVLRPGAVMTCAAVPITGTHRNRGVPMGISETWDWLWFSPPPREESSQPWLSRGVPGEE